MTTYQISTAVIWYSTSAFAIITDIAIIALPINEIRRLQLPRVQKLMLMFLFSLGLLYVFSTDIALMQRLLSANKKPS